MNMNNTSKILFLLLSEFPSPIHNFYYKLLVSLVDGAVLNNNPVVVLDLISGTGYLHLCAVAPVLPIRFHLLVLGAI